MSVVFVAANWPDAALPACSAVAASCSRWSQMRWLGLIIIPLSRAVWLVDDVFYAEILSATVRLCSRDAVSEVIKCTL